MSDIKPVKGTPGVFPVPALPGQPPPVAAIPLGGRLMTFIHEPQAAVAIFGWCVTAASDQVEPAVVLAKFGDGYAQRRPDGINTQEQKWSLEARNQRLAVADEIVAFLSARNGVDVFNWTPPRTDTPLDVICPTWTYAYGDMLPDGSRLYNVTMTFEQAFV